MFPPFILGILFLIGLLFLIRWYISADARSVKRKLTYLLLLILLAFFIFLAVTGRLAAAFGVFMAIITFGRRVFGLISILNWFKNFFRVAPADDNNVAGNYKKKKSNVHTKFLRMTLDHDSGELDGLIIFGKLKGKLLSNLNLDDLIDFRQDILNDNDSLHLLNSYLDRKYQGWRSKYKSDDKEDKTDTTYRNSVMTTQEAIQILGVDINANNDEIKEAYKQLISKFHPDKGGSSYLATKINQAKEILLKK
tara:strand:- start:104 stop:856 length:753 start_codon:yes stop_codon:yes gene_type:complete